MNGKYFSILLFELNKLINKRYTRTGKIIEPSTLNQNELKTWNILIQKANKYQKSFNRFISSIDMHDKYSFINYNNIY